MTVPLWCLAIIAFLPLIVLIFTNKNMGGQQKAIAGVVGIAALTAINLALLLFLLARALPAGAHEYTVLRGRSLEIVDEVGRVRASIQVHPANPDVVLPDGSELLRIGQEGADHGSV